MTKIYLDTSALVKRYVEEEGSEEVDAIFEKAYGEEVKLVISQWNIAEAVVVFDKYERKGILEAKQTINLLQNELETMVRMQYFKITPIGSMIAESIPLILAHHIYVADAIQILTCRQENCDLFATFDKKLRKVAKAEGLNVSWI
ncbi:MAG: type II toxin-antitoxin system VapC family toxin [Archaeoglobus sp.]|nr:type II toxin-antitoxin system VapC family toxin [Archaeoglobus sp.]